MKRSGLPCSPAQAGFVLVEAVVAVALIALSAGAALAAVAAVTHAAAHAAAEPALTLGAQNVLTDLRAATAYDPVQLAALAGRSAAFDVDEPGAAPRRVHVVASVAGSAAAGYTATITVSEPDGASVSVRSVLVQEAPAPGSFVPAATPAPACDGAPAACARTPNRIAL